MLIAFVRQQHYTRAPHCYIMPTLPVLFSLLYFRRSVSSCRSLQDTQNMPYEYLKVLCGTFLDWVMHIEREGKYFVATEWR